MRNAVISVGVIDEKRFTRECIIQSLQTLDDRLLIEGFPTCDECLRTAEGQDVVVYYLKEDPSQWEGNSRKLFSFRELLKIAPMIVLSDTENQNLLKQIFESGARCCIPTENSSPEQIIAIIRLL